MYFTSLPDHSEPGFDEQLHFSKFRKHNIIFNAPAKKSYCERHIGCLSVKMVTAGEEWYNIGTHELAVRPGQFLILNDDQEYSCRVDTPGKGNIQSVFFRKEFASSVFRNAMFKTDMLLDNPFTQGEKALEFFQTLYDIDTRMHQKLVGLTRTLDEYGYDRNLVDEHLFFLLNELIRFHKKECFREGELYAVKPGTRREIYKRICIAKDMLHSNYMNKTSLDELSTIACISVPQLIRHFKAAFQLTPHQYLTRIRLSHAARLLKQASAPVHEITWMCGFENTSSFCRAFKSEYGVQPVHFRNMN